jgi:excisionase family DNA binding protein
MAVNTTEPFPTLASDLFNNDQSAAYLGITPRTLEVWRCTKRHKIPYIKVGRLVKYRKSALDAFLDQQTVDAE